MPLALSARAEAQHQLAFPQQQASKPVVEYHKFHGTDRLGRHLPLQGEQAGFESVAWPH
jgi:hypothetical protein